MSISVMTTQASQPGKLRNAAFIDQVRAMVEYQSSLAKRPMILSMLAGAQNYVGSTWYRRATDGNRARADIYGDTFIDDRRRPLLDRSGHTHRPCSPTT